MVIDSSALLAILLGEPEGPAFRTRIDADDTRLASTATLLESSLVVLGRLGDKGADELAALLRVAEVVPTAFTAEQLPIAIDAFRRFGKGRHPAGLNLGDCFSYALAKATGEPLLFKGDDFLQTDIKQAVWDRAVRPQPGPPRRSRLEQVSHLGQARAPPIRRHQ